MAKRRAKKTSPPESLKAEFATIPGSDNPLRISRRKRWFFRLAAALLIPAALFAFSELILRLTGFGYPTAFLVPASQSQREVLVPNNQFGWRFFSPQMARLPEPFAFPRTKPPGTIRILLLGESAAKGEPLPAFGLPRLLQTILSQRHPEARFEVINCAMTAINSHAIRAIAHDGAAVNADIWVIYMGNNEVVGPFGAGTVFSRQTPPLWLIQTALALQSTRTGQAIEAMLAKLKPPAEDEPEWRGMKMFLDQQVPADDPRMSSVYHHFKSNLADIIETGRRSGAGIVVSTVGVNLRDCAPFASTHRANLSGEDKNRWDELYQLGVAAQVAGNHSEALRKFATAANLDNGFAELRFRQATSALALGQVREAEQHFVAARDLDTLRFRCDSQLNGLIRQAATNRESERIILADAERTLAEQSPGEVSGDEFFYEHVHLTFKGNHLLAQTLAEQVERLLSEKLAARGGAETWPTEAECAQRLGWSDWSRFTALQAILARKQSAPFIGQANHEEQLRTLSTQGDQLSAALQPNVTTEGRRACEAALVNAPDDPVLLGQLSSFQQSAGDFTAAVKSIRRELELLPGNPVAWQRLGLNLASLEQFDEAGSAFRSAIKLNPADAGLRLNLGQTLRQSGRQQDAILEFRRAAKLRPNYAAALLSLGESLEQLGHKDEAAISFQKAFAGNAHRGADLTVLARFCRSRGWIEAAVTNYNAALDINPRDAQLRIEVGQLLMASGRTEDAGKQFSKAVMLSPYSAVARQLYGLILGQQGRSADAEMQFREALRLAPERLQTQLDLGMALLAQGKPAEALPQFEAVLQRSPTNKVALKYVQLLRAQSQR